MSGPPRQRVLTAPLLVFLGAVAGVLTYALVQRLPMDLERAVTELADGDLDGEERRVALERVALLAAGSEPVRHRWAGLLAALALGDRERFAALRARLVDANGRWLLPAPADRALLDLGDRLLANALDAMLAEASGEASLALREWGQVAMQARLIGHPLAAELAADALLRLR